MLGFLLAAIWGRIGYQLFIKKAAGEVSESGSQAISDQKSPHSEHFNFNARVRDPFAYFTPAPKVKKTRNPVPLIVHLWTPPPVSLAGVILGDGKRTAILDGRSGETYFLSEGDTLEGVKILKVADKEVVYRYQDKDTSWTLVR